MWHTKIIITKKLNASNKIYQCIILKPPEMDFFRIAKFKFFFLKKGFRHFNPKATTMPMPIIEP